MQLSSNLWIGSDLSDAAFADLAQGLLSSGDIAHVSRILVQADRYPALWASEAGQVLLIEMLQILIETLEAGEIDAALAALDVCPPHLAGQAQDLLIAAFCPGGDADLSELGDAVVLALAMLTGTSGRRDAVAPLVESAAAGRSDAYYRPMAQAVIAHFAPRSAAREPFKAKLIIWDLDDTLWQGTLADGDVPVLDETRADFVRALNRHGIVSAICSKNDHAAAKAQLERFGLWEAFVFPRIAFVPKGAVIRQMIADMQLRPANVLFIDDNPHNLHEVAAAVPGIRVVDATAPECDALLRQILADNAHVEKSRVADYRLLETKVAERSETALTDEAFLLQSEIRATYTYRLDNLEFAERIEELINRSNQLNYTASRVEPGTIRARILDIDHHDVLCAFVWDRYGYYGLVGVAVYDFEHQRLDHLAFSCRIMHMGVEDFLIRALAERGHRVDPGQLRKPLPAQSAAAIAALPYADPAVRARVLAEEAPRDWSRVRLRIMADCQSGAFHHYSRFRDEADFDNRPRLFSLPMMRTGDHADQLFPPCLVLTAATDYIDWRWEALSPALDEAIFADCVARYADMVVDGDHKCLLFLPPQEGPEPLFRLTDDLTPDGWRARHRTLNDLWRDVARRHPGHFSVIELETALAPDEMINAYHYVPSALQRMAGMIDDWYAGQTKR